MLDKNSLKRYKDVKKTCMNNSFFREKFDINEFNNDFNQMRKEFIDVHKEKNEFDVELAYTYIINFLKKYNITIEDKQECKKMVRHFFAGFQFDFLEQYFLFKLSFFELVKKKTS